MDESRAALYAKCKQRLLKVKQDRMNGLKALQSDLTHEAVGDEGDMAQVFETQHSSIIQREKMLVELKEIEEALKRIDDGHYGICEETGEPIEPDRLMAIPWTRLSIEGAESREQIRKKFA